MENTSPKKFRAKLKNYLNLAKKEVVRIKRRSGRHFILLSEEKYNQLKLDLNALQKRILNKKQVNKKVVHKVRHAKAKAS